MTVTADHMWSPSTGSVNGVVLEVGDDGRIAEVRWNQGADPARGAAARRIDLDGLTILPGLIDAHVHLAFDASTDPVAALRATGDDDLLASMRRAAHRMLVAGITTARDLGDRNYLSLDLRAEFAADPAAGPTLSVSGPPITTRGGHCWYLGGEIDAADAEAAVAERVARGVDVIKVMGTGGHLTAGSRPERTQFTAETLRRIIDAAHAAGLPVAVHAHAPAGIADAVACGADSIEHCSFMTRDSVEPDAATLRALAASPTVVSLTLGQLPGPAPQAIAVRLPLLLDLLRQFRELDIEVVLGTDAGIGPPKPHDVLPLAIAQAVAAGFPPEQALLMATRRPAHLLRMEHLVGDLRPGLQADLIAVHDDPLADPTTLQRVRAVIHRGRLVVPATDGHRGLPSQSNGDDLPLGVWNLR